jgi:hypothetical protein
MKARQLLAVMAALVLTSSSTSAQLFSSSRKVPKVLEARFVTGEPVWLAQH